MTEKEVKKTLLGIAKAYANELGYGKHMSWHEGIHYYLDDKDPTNIIWMRPDHDDGYANEYILTIKHDGTFAHLSAKKSEDGWAIGHMETRGDEGFQRLTDMYRRFKEAEGRYPLGPIGKQS